MSVDLLVPLFIGEEESGENGPLGVWPCSSDSGKFFSKYGII